MSSNVEYISEVYILSVPLESDYKHTLYFKDSIEQENYFKSRIVRRFNDFNYIRKDSTIKVGATDANGLNSDCDSLLNAGVNYVMYKNKKYNGKTFYAFIKELRYENDNLTSIEIETDVLQTWFFNYHLKESFVEREHVADDTIGLHTQPEGLETGEYICNDEDTLDFGDMYIVMATTQLGSTEFIGGVYNGAYSGVRYVACKVTNYSGINTMLKQLTDDYGAGDAVTSIFMCPKFLLGEIADGKDVSSGSFQAKADEFIMKKHYAMLGDYTPHNNKLYTFPFNYLLASNNCGGNAIYKYEDFDTRDTLNENDIIFKYYGALCPGGSIKIVPEKYKGTIGNNIEESLNAGKFAICNWNTDVYTNWLTQNSVNMSLSYASAGLQIVSGVALMGTGAGALAGAGSVANGALAIAQTMGQKYQQSLVPRQAEGNLNAGDVINAMGENNIKFYCMSIKGEYAEIIDKYFDAYGYQVNKIKIPNKNHRAKYWYTKTIDVNIDGKIPNNDMQKIKDCYNNGLTFWKNAEEIQNYSLGRENVIV